MQECWAFNLTALNENNVNRLSYHQCHGLTAKRSHCIYIINSEASALYCSLPVGFFTMLSLIADPMMRLYHEDDERNASKCVQLGECR